MNREPRPVVDSKNRHAEGPVWLPEKQTLLWTDIETAELCVYGITSGEYTRISLPEKLGSFAVIDENTILTAFAKRICVYDLPGKQIVRCVPIESDIPETRMNDGRTDRSGRFVVSGFDPAGRGRSATYQIGPDLAVRRWFGGVSSGNSICFSPDGTVMYFADSPEARIWAYDYDAAATSISNKRLFYDFADEPGLPDGSVVDSDGYLWNAEWNGYRLIRISPEGKRDQIVEMPVKNPTCVAFGGEDLKSLFITTSRLMLSDDELKQAPTSGSLYAIDIECPGLRDERFRLEPS
ncbi:MAG: SMP-30/gluconolactonase/LRE family protein [Spirochaetaceae bacterium]|nr:SMP-30/gluconolactonase/LRE family protein [Spirochaetaceae bacterium]